jgi:UDP-N-acetylglucosamine:LPS N-acetylglucosamine transferase
MTNKKYLLFYLKTGGGHLAPAKAIAEQLNKHPGISTVLVDGLEKSNKIVRYLIEDGYRNLQARAKWYYEFLYATNKFSLIAKFNCAIFTRYTKDYLREVIKNEQPEKIILFHFFFIEPVYRLLKELNISIPVITVVTDPFTAHPIWFMKKDQNFLLFSEELKNKITPRISPERIKVLPFVLTEQYSSPLSADEISNVKEKLGYPPDKKILMVMGGGDGIPNGRKILKEILFNVKEAAVAVVCGKNKALYNYACSLKEEYNAENFFVYGYVDFIYELINISDVVLTKCGASSMMEILMLHKVPVVNSYIWEQEKGNKEFLVKNNFGIYEPDLKKLSSKIKMLLNDEKLYNFYKQNIISAELENGSAKAAGYIMDF